MKHRGLPVTADLCARDGAESPVILFEFEKRKKQGSSRKLAMDRQFFQIIILYLREPDINPGWYLHLLNIL